MELKDWIILIIPIICNGVILFCFQQLFLLKTKKSEKINTYKEDVLKQFLSLLQEFYTLLRNLQKIDSTRSGKDYSFSELWNPATEIMSRLVVFADTHPATIGESTLGFTACVETWQGITDLLYSEAQKNNYTMTKECSEKFTIEYVRMNELIKKCMSQCEKEILNLYG